MSAVCFTLIVMNDDPFGLLWQSRRLWSVSVAATGKVFVDAYYQGSDTPGMIWFTLFEYLLQ